MKLDYLVPEGIARMVEWCRQERIDCLYFLADCSSAATMVLAAENRFFQTDIRITLSCNTTGLITAMPNSNSIRSGCAQDLDRLEAIARCSHHDSRFYFDERFSRQKCDDLYANWMRKSFSGLADEVLVAEWNGAAAGYITCRITEPGKGEIGLLGVDGRARGHGLGPQLVGGALQWFRDRNVKTVTVVTQGRNVIAQRCYQRAGFLTDTIQLWFHRWFSYALPS
ncbi:MAG: GNAT family N-acetyltransferase [Verrucomicrobiota bacterium]